MEVTTPTLKVVAAIAIALVSLSHSLHGQSDPKTVNYTNFGVKPEFQVKGAGDVEFSMYLVYPSDDPLARPKTLEATIKLYLGRKGTRFFARFEAPVELVLGDAIRWTDDEGIERNSKGYYARFPVVTWNNGEGADVDIDTELKFPEKLVLAAYETEGTMYSKPAKFSKFAWIGEGRKAICILSHATPW